MNRRTGLCVLSVACLLVAASVAFADPFDGMTLMVNNGAGSSVTLDWTGGQPTFTVFRATSPQAVTGSGNLIGSTDLRTFGDTPPADIGAKASFAWLAGEQFLIERWEVPLPEAPDGIAIIGADRGREGGYLQHYFDSRGVARVYKMSVEEGVWRLWRDEPDFSPLDFSQRFTGTFSADGTTIAGRWEICQDGTTWEHDFDLTYARA